MKVLIGTHLEKAGWRQGSVVKHSDLQNLLHILKLSYEDNLELLLASQSCDIANNSTDLEPTIELSIARKINVLDGHFTNNKNPRILHTHISRRTGNKDVYIEEKVELKACDRISIQKEHLLNLQPDSMRELEDRQLKSYVAWLAARYSRPALPTKFNDLLRKADPKGKLRKIAKQGNEQLVGIYVQITPDSEIDDIESYSVNLLGLLPAGFSGDYKKSEDVIKAYADALEEAGIDVLYTVSSEDKISIAQISRFKRFYLDDLSFQEETPHPPETRITM